MQSEQKTAHNNTWDLLVIGGGPGGYVAAIRAAQLGMRVICIDRRTTLGGTCLNAGCIPSKALLESSLHYWRARHTLAEHGVTIGAVQLDLLAMQSRKEKIVTTLTQGIAQLFRKYGVTYLQGEAKLLSADQIAVTQADGTLFVMQKQPNQNIILATGGRSAELPPLPLDGEWVIDSQQALALKQVPEHLLVVGGGAIGLELGSVWRRLGAQVTLLEAMPEILPGVDDTLLRHAKRLFLKQGLQLQTNTKVTQSRIENGCVHVRAIQETDKELEFTADKVLLAAGRRPAVNASGAVDIGVELDHSGRIAVNNRFETSIAGIYAIGDIIAGPMLAHKAMAEGTFCAEMLAHPNAPSPLPLDHRLIPAVVYTSPEVAMVGLTEKQAKNNGLEIHTGQFSFLANGRARACGEADGVAKVIIERSTQRLIGVHILGSHASELIAMAAQALAAGQTCRQFAATILPHPTLSEALKEAALAALGEAVHA
ncbi:MAG: dihydrolipoyl dehydrogenase [Magnetococcus sp. DMHC-6]